MSNKDKGVDVEAHAIVDRKTWLAERRALLEEEKMLDKLRDGLAAKRRALPYVSIDAEYVFLAADGHKVSLGDCFGEHSQLIVQHFMWAEESKEGCPSCTFWADQYDRMQPYLAQRDCSVVAVATAAPEKLEAYRQRFGWTLPFLSSAESDFSSDFNVTFAAEDVASGEDNYNFKHGGWSYGSEAPGVSVFLRLDSGHIVHTYSTYARGLDMLNGAYHNMDILPRGRDEADGNMAWLKRRA